MTDPVTPSPDDKDWTWVLERPCPDCEFDSSAIAAADVADVARGFVARLRSRLDADDAKVRPEPAVWSPVEYAAHVRDVCIVFGARLALMRASADPLFANWDQDETALAERYWEQPVAAVAAELSTEGERFCVELDSVRPEEWTRPGRRSNGSVFTVDSLSRYFLHDLAHHVHDVGA